VGVVSRAADMRPAHRTRPARVASLGLALLSACGLTLPWSGDEAVPVHLTVYPAAVRVDAALGDPAPAPIAIAISVDKPDVMVVVEFDGPAIESVRPLGDRLEVTIPASDALGVGTWSGSIRLRACRAPDCAPMKDGSAAVGITYAVRPFPLVLSADPVSFEVVEGMPPPAPQSVSFSDADASGPWTASVQLSGFCPYVDVSVSPASGSMAPAELSVAATQRDSISGPLTCSGTLYVNAANRTVSKSISISLRRPRLFASPATLAFDGVAGQLPLPPGQPIAVTTEVGTLPYFVGISYEPGVAPWLSLDQASSGYAPVTMAARPSRSDLAPGVHTAVVSISSGSGYPGPATVSVTYTLAARQLHASPAGWSPIVGPSTVAADLSQSVALSDSGTALSWTATANVPWLSVSPPSGTTGVGAATSIAILPSALETLPFGPSAAVVTFAYDAPGGGAEQVVVPVSLYLALGQLTHVMPRTAVAGVAGPGAAYGVGAWGITVGGVDVVPSLNQLTFPALAAGTYPVSVLNALGLSRSQASLRVVDPVTRAASATASPGRKTQLAFDDAAGVLYAANAGAGAVERFREAAGWAREALPIAGLRDAALSPDGATLAALAGAEVKVVDAASFALDPQQPAAAIPEPGAAALDWRIAYGGDRRALLIRADAQAGTPYLFDGASLAAVAGGARPGGQPGVPGDGTDIWITHPSASPALPVTVYQTTFQSFLDRTAFAGDHVSADRGGVFILFQRDGSASGTSDTLLLDARTAFPVPGGGKLPGTIANAILTQDGSRAVALDGSTGNVRVFAFDPATGLFAELGPAGGTAPIAPPGPGAVLALSADDRTLFLAGDGSVVVFPLP
jgi:Viral BACON domain